MTCLGYSLGQASQQAPGAIWLKNQHRLSIFVLVAYRSYREYTPKYIPIPVICYIPKKQICSVHFFWVPLYKSLLGLGQASNTFHFSFGWTNSTTGSTMLHCQSTTFMNLHDSWFFAGAAHRHFRATTCGTTRLCQSWRLGLCCPGPPRGSVPVLHCFKFEKVDGSNSLEVEDASIDYATDAFCFARDCKSHVGVNGQCSCIRSRYCNMRCIYVPLIKGSGSHSAMPCQTFFAGPIQTVHPWFCDLVCGSFHRCCTAQLVTAPSRRLGPAFKNLFASAFSICPHLSCIRGSFVSKTDCEVDEIVATWPRVADWGQILHSYVQPMNVPHCDAWNFVWNFDDVTPSQGQRRLRVKSFPQAPSHSIHHQPPMTRERPGESAAARFGCQLSEAEVGWWQWCGPHWLRFVGRVFPGVCVCPKKCEFTPNSNEFAFCTTFYALKYGVTGWTCISD